MCNCSKDKTVIVPSPTQAIKGAVSITKTIIGVGVANSTLQASRLAICHSCDKLNIGALKQCTVCSCIVNQKVQRVEEKCPLKLW